MGYYIEVPKVHDKAALIVAGEVLVYDDGEGWKNAPAYEAEITERPASFADVPDCKALICVVDNGIFEGAGYCFSEAEFEAFSDPSDRRPRTWVLMDKALAEQASGYAR